MSSHLKLAKRADGVAALMPIDEILFNTRAEPFPVNYQPWTDASTDDNLGRPNRTGFPLGRWHFEWLSQPDVDTLLGYEGEVYVRTEKRTGLIRELKNFAADLVITDLGDPILPENGVPEYPQRRGPIEVEHRNMVEQ